MNTFRRSLVLLFALALPFAAFAAAPIEIDEDIVRVSFADIDIDTEAGARTLYSRLQKASRSACDLESLTTFGSIERRMISKACYTETLNDFVSRLDSEALNKIHAG